MKKYSVDLSKYKYQSITISMKDYTPTQWTLTTPSAWGTVQMSRFARSGDDVDFEWRALEQKVDQSGYREAKEILRKF
jgi:hypothetical protein